MRHIPLAALAAILAVGAFTAGCSPAPTSTPPPSSAPIDAGPLLDTEALLAAAPARDGQVVHVTGFVLISDQVRLCSVVLESYPPQCGGAAVHLTGEIPADVVAALDKTTEPDLAQANWGWVDVTGTFTVAGGPRIQINQIRVVAQ